MDGSSVGAASWRCDGVRKVASDAGVDGMSSSRGRGGGNSAGNQDDTRPPALTLRNAATSGVGSWVMGGGVEKGAATERLRSDGGTDQLHPIVD